MSGNSKEKKLITALEVAKILNCSRGQVDRLQLKGLIKAVPTIYPIYYFNKSEILEYKENLTPKR